MHSACDRPQRRAPKPRPLAASMPTLPLPIALSLVSSCLIVPAAPSRLSRRDPNTSMRVACTEGRRGSQVGRGAVRGRIFRGAGAHQPVRDGVGRKLRPPRLDAADRAVDAELVRLSDQRPVHARAARVEAADSADRDAALREQRVAAHAKRCTCACSATTPRSARSSQSTRVVCARASEWRVL